jgi:hypothetical protein
MNILSIIGYFENNPPLIFKSLLRIDEKVEIRSNVPV